MSDKFEDFFRKKTTHQLYRIFKGFENSSYNNRVLAEKILKEQDFDFENIEKYKDKWELEKLTKEIVEENQGVFTYMYNPSHFLFSAIGGFCGFLIIIISSSIEYKVNNSLTQNEYIGKIALSIFLLVFGLIMRKLWKNRKKTIKNRELKIDKLTSNIINK